MASVLESTSWEFRYSVSTIDTPNDLPALRIASLATRTSWAFTGASVLSAATAGTATHMPIRTNRVSLKRICISSRMPQSGDDVDRGPAPGRNPGRHQGHQSQCDHNADHGRRLAPDTHRERHGIHPARGSPGNPAMVDRKCEANSDDDPENRSRESQQHPLDDEDPADAGATQPDRSQGSDLRRSLHDRHAHGVADCEKY